jgi:hypothetical protein
VSLVYFSTFEPINLTPNSVMQKAGVHMLYDTASNPRLPSLYICPAANVLLRAPLIPCCAHAVRHPSPGQSKGTGWTELARAAHPPPPCYCCGVALLLRLLARHHRPPANSAYRPDDGRSPARAPRALATMPTA